MIKTESVTAAHIKGTVECSWRKVVAVEKAPSESRIFGKAESKEAVRGIKCPSEIFYVDAYALAAFRFSRIATKRLQSSLFHTIIIQLPFCFAS